MTWDTFEEACLLMGLDPDRVFFGEQPPTDAEWMRFEDGAALVRLFGGDPDVMTPEALAAETARCAALVFDALQEASHRAERYKTYLERRYPHLFKQDIPQNVPPLRVTLSKFAPSDYADVVSRWDLSQIYLWLLSLKVQQFDDMIREAIRQQRALMN